ncbi:MAG: aminodeoxychorismate synthase component I [Anaerolineales bacterium]|nr:aminodeoxychorismate synthase component I [Anaerolineales bacterium]
MNEVLLKENDQWLHFTEPKQIITTQSLDDVIPSLQEIERLTQVNGWHAAGFISYEAAPAFDKALRPEQSGAQKDNVDEFPLLWFGLYPAPRIITLPEPDSAKPALSWLTTVDRDTYNTAIEQIKDYIAQGQTYQVNYTMRLRAEFKTDPWNFFLHLAQTQNNHAAYIDLGRYIIASASPEFFFRLNGDIIESRPMKGTTRRGRTTLEDEEQAQWLKDSEKNRAENVMIVDMIRNDLGRIAKVGSVHIPELFSTEKYPTLWQMTSTVRAKTSASLTEIFEALFPCASITGAPKVSTMRIISELETSLRKIYTGSIGHIAPNRKATFNVAIRTALIDRKTQTAEYGVGSGIVWDSINTDEYTEALLKARVLTEETQQFSLLETLLWTPEESFFLREKHIERLLDSAKYFDFPVARKDIENYLNEISSQFTSPQRVRLLLDKHGNLQSETKPYESVSDHPPLNVRLAKEPVHSGNVFLFHKTTHREIYEVARKGLQEYDDVLLYNENNELTEFTIGNLVVELNGKLYTPPISCGLLAGTFRAHLLETSQVEERVIRVEELKDCTKIFLVNSVRKWEIAVAMNTGFHTNM